MPEILQHWACPPPDIILGPGQVHVWRGRLVAPVPEHWQYLSPDELERARRYRFQRDRDRFAAGRIFLRQVLARHLDVEPAEVRFRYSEHGRPSLDSACLGDSGCSGLDFNLAHSEDRALIALGMGVGVGIDLERIDPIKVDDGMLGLACSPAERRWLASLPRQEQVACFYQCWTRKEAYLKARGEGLILPMSDFSVLPADGEPAAATSTLAGACVPASIALMDLSAWSEFAACLAVAVSPEETVPFGSCSLRLWDWR